MRPSPGAGLRRQQEQRQPLPLGPGPARGVGEQAPPQGLRHQFAQQRPRQAVGAVVRSLQVRGQRAVQGLLHGGVPVGVQEGHQGPRHVHQQLQQPPVGPGGP